VEAADAIAIALLSAAAAFVQALSGFGFSLFLVPLLAIVVGAKDAVVLANALGVAVNVAMVARTRRLVSWRLGVTLFAGAAAGMPVGLLVLIVVDPSWLQAGIALLVLATTAALWRGWRAGVTGRAAEAGAGVVSGILNTSTSMSGPPVVLFLQARGTSPAVFRATLGAFFLASGFVALALFGASGRLGSTVLLQTLVAVPGLVLGFLGGDAVFARMGEFRFRRVVFVILVGTAAVALATAFR
jgi:uncharacterized membrane protein YfcA